MIKYFLSIIVFLGFSGMFYAHADVSCPVNVDWPNSFCPNYDTDFEKRKDSWKEYFEYKGAQWMEGKKTELLDAINKNILHEWIAQVDDQSHTNVYLYYFYTETIPGENGIFASKGCMTDYDVPCLSMPVENMIKENNEFDNICNDGLELVFRNRTWNNSCVKPSSVSELTSREWAISDDTARKIFSTNKVFATLQGDSKVTSLDGILWNTGPAMTYVDTDINGILVLATSSGSDTVYAFDSANNQMITSIKVGNTPKGVKIHPGGGLAFVANEASGTISVINLDSWNIIREIPVGKIPHNIVFDQIHNLAYVTIQGEDKVAIIDTVHLNVTGFIPVGKLPHNLDISKSGDILYVATIGTSDVAVIDLHTGEIIKRIPVSTGHHGIDVSNDGKRVYVSGIGADKINIIDTDSLELIKQIQVGNGPHGIRSAFDDSLIYVGVTATNEIVIVDSNTLEIKERIPTGNTPFWIATPMNP